MRKSYQSRTAHVASESKSQVAGKLKSPIIMLIYFILLIAPNTANGIGYTQDWLRGDEVGDRDQAHVHEGLRLADRTGWVGVGGTISEQTARKVM